MFHDDLCKCFVRSSLLPVILAVQNKVRRQLAHCVYLQESETVTNWETNGKFSFHLFCFSTFCVCV